MDDFASSPTLTERRGQLLKRMSEFARRKREDSLGLVERVEPLREAGALAAAFPEQHGGLGLGTEPSGAADLAEILRLVGRASLSLGRVFEGHVNAVQLVARYGNPEQVARGARDARRGSLFAIWNTEPQSGVRLGSDGVLIGRKIHCSAAGVATRAVITVDQSEGGRLLVVELDGAERRSPPQGALHGMRETLRGDMDFTGYRPEQRQWIGKLGDYLREPVFSAGAWRTLAVLVGGLEALVEQVAAQLKERGRETDLRQRARLAQLFIDLETARLWVASCAARAEGGDYMDPGAANYVALGRRAVEIACLDAIQLAQRSIGLAAFIDVNPLERLMRDLSTYLRQPALDEALSEAAGALTTDALFDRESPVAC